MTQHTTWYRKQESQTEILIFLGKCCFPLLFLLQQLAMSLPPLIAIPSSGCSADLPSSVSSIVLCGHGHALASLAWTAAMTFSLASFLPHLPHSSLLPQAKQCTLHYCNGYFFIARTRLPSGQLRSYESHSPHPSLRPEMPSIIPTIPLTWYQHQIVWVWFQHGPLLSLLSVLWGVTMRRAKLGTRVSHLAPTNHPLQGLFLS